MLLTECGNDNRVWVAPMRHYPVRSLSHLAVRSPGSYVSYPVWMTDTYYEGEYMWVGVSLEVAKAKVDALNAGAGTLGGDGSTGLQLTVTEPAMSGTSLTTHTRQVMMGSASVEPMGGRMYAVRVSISYVVTTAEDVEEVGA